MKVRLKDIAEATGYSLMTVSLALNPRQCGVRISETTREKIEKAARDMNYVPNIPARILSGGHSNVIGVMFNALNDGFFSELILRIDASLTAHGYTGLYTFWENYDDFERSLEFMKQYRVCGILTGHEKSAAYPDVPVLCYGVRHPDFESIYPDNEIIIARAVEYVCQQGYHHIGFIGKKKKGCRGILFIQEMQKRGLKPFFFMEEKMDDSIEMNVDALLQNSSGLPEVMIFSSDQIAFKWIAELQSRGLQLPRDMKVIGIDNVPFCDNITPRLTSVDFQLSHLGGQLIDRLLQLCADPGKKREDIILPVSIVERNSCPQKK